LQAETITPVLQEFITQKLLVHVDGRYLSLALPAHPHW
jgi:hypothetical protein